MSLSSLKLPSFEYVFLQFLVDPRLVLERYKQSSRTASRVEPVHRPPPSKKIKKLFASSLIPLEK